MTEYKDKFTYDGRLRPVAGVTREGVRKIKGLLEKAINEGSIVADAQLREMVTSDVVAARDLAHLINVQVLPQFDKADRVWDQIATVREVPNFRKTTLMSFYAADGEKQGFGPNGELSLVPEGQPYPHVTVKGDEAAYQSIAKHGNRVDFSWEASIDDTTGFISDLPSLLTGAAVDTEEAEVFAALKAAGPTALAGGTLIDGTVVAANAKAHPASIIQAIKELETRTFNGRVIGASSKGYNVVVANGQKRDLDALIRRWNSAMAFHEGAYVFGDSGTEGIDVTVIETEHFTGTNWTLLPRKGGYRRPVLDLLRLRGHATPELRVRENGEFSYDEDVASFRLRYALGASRWYDTFIVPSTGAGTVTLPTLKVEQLP